MNSSGGGDCGCRGHSRRGQDALYGLVFAALADGDWNGDAGAGVVSRVYLLLQKAEERSPAMRKCSAGCTGRKKEVIKCSI